jgi:hypothetical protein
LFFVHYFFRWTPFEAPGFFTKGSCRGGFPRRLTFCPVGLFYMRICFLCATLQFYYLTIFWASSHLYSGIR